MSQSSIKAIITFLDGTTAEYMYVTMRTLCAGRVLELVDAANDTLLLNVDSFQTLQTVREDA